MKKKLVVTYFK